MVESVDFPCPICGSPKTSPLYPGTLNGKLPRMGYGFTPKHRRTFPVVLCVPCRHAYASPRPSGLVSMYRDVTDRAYLARRQDNLRTARKVLSRLSALRPGGRLLDIGCGTGDFLLAAREHYQSEGLEPSAWAAARGRSRELTIHETDLAHFRPSQPYDLATLWGVIEHFEEPGLEVDRIAKLLAPGGMVCLWTGDRDSLPSKLLGRHWWYMMGQHLQLFSRHSLMKMFRDRGFEPAWLGRYPYSLTMKSLACSLGRYPVLGGAVFRLLSRPPLSKRSLTFALPGEMFAIFRKGGDG